MELLYFKISTQILSNIAYIFSINNVPWDVQNIELAELAPKYDNFKLNCFNVQCNGRKYRCSEKV